MLTLILRYELLLLGTSLLCQIMIRICAASAMLLKTCADVQRTSISGHLVQPLCLLPILALPTPSRDLRLPLVIPYFLVAPLGPDTFGVCEAFLLGWGF